MLYKGKTTLNLESRYDFNSKYSYYGLAKSVLKLNKAIQWKNLNFIFCHTLKFKILEYKISIADNAIPDNGTPEKYPKSS